MNYCNFKYSYTIKGLVIGGDGMDEIDDGIDDAGTYNIKVWVDDKIVPLTQTQIQEFVSSSGGKYTINATVEPQSEGTAASSMLQDVQSGADIFVFAQDQLARLKVAGAVSKLTGNYDTFVRTIRASAYHQSKIFIHLSLPLIFLKGIYFS